MSLLRINKGKFQKVSLWFFQQCLWRNYTQQWRVSNWQWGEENIWITSRYFELSFVPSRVSCVCLLISSLRSFGLVDCKIRLLWIWLLD